MPHLPESRPVPFAELVESWRRAGELLGRSPQTDRLYRGAVERFQAWAAAAAPEILADVRMARRADLERFVLDCRREGLAWSTIRAIFQQVRAILLRGLRDELLVTVPQIEIRWGAKIAEDRRAGRTPERGQRVLELVPLCLDAAEELAYWRELNLSVPALLRFLAFTGARCGEILLGEKPSQGVGLRWGDLHGLDTSAPTAVIRGGKGRAYGPRRIPVPEPAARGVRGLVRGAPEDLVWPWRRVSKSWDKVRERAAQRAPQELQAAARALRIHDLRHFASHYWRSLGVPDRLIDRLLGHRTPVIAQRYAAADEREVGEACARALGASPPGPDPRPDDRGGALDVPDIITIDFDYWHRRNGSAAAGGGD